MQMRGVAEMCGVAEMRCVAAKRRPFLHLASSRASCHRLSVDRSTPSVLLGGELENANKCNSHHHSRRVDARVDAWWWVFERVCDVFHGLWTLVRVLHSCCVEFRPGLNELTRPSSSFSRQNTFHKDVFAVDDASRFVWLSPPCLGPHALPYGLPIVSCQFCGVVYGNRTTGSAAGVHRVCALSCFRCCCCFYLLLQRRSHRHRRDR